MVNVALVRRIEPTNLGKLEQGVIGDQMTLASKSNEPTGPLHRLNVQGKTSATLNESESLDGEIESEISWGPAVFSINENNLACCLQVYISFGNGISASAFLDNGRKHLDRETL
jgi:hypothetical protein